MTMRRWMVAVAVVAFVLGGFHLKRRRDDLMLKADVHTIIVEMFSYMVRVDEQDDARYTRRATYHAAMARKYRHAARYPWRRVEPDPPEPK
jgi:hypothetical protein